MGIDRSNEIKAVTEVFGEYLPRFNSILWDTRFIALALMNIDVKKLFTSVEDEGVREALFESLGRFVKEGQEGYTIFKFSLTFYWAEIESFMDTFLIKWLTHAKSPATLPVFEKINFKQTVGEFEKLSRDEVIALYVKGLKDHVRKGSEIKTFFAALDKIGLDNYDGKEKMKLERLFTELQQIRNVMVHRAGIVDKRMIVACPWLQSKPEIEIGKMYPLDIEVVQHYGRHIFDFTDHILDRLDRYASDTWTD